MIGGHGDDDDGDGGGGGGGEDDYDDGPNSPLVEEPCFTLIWNGHCDLKANTTFRKDGQPLAHILFIDFWKLSQTWKAHYSQICKIASMTKTFWLFGSSWLLKNNVILSLQRQPKVKDLVIHQIGWWVLWCIWWYILWQIWWQIIFTKFSDEIVIEFIGKYIESPNVVIFFVIK